MIVEVQGEFHAAGGNRGLEIHAGVQRREDEHEGANNFRERVREVVVNGGNRGEHAELDFLIGGGFPMRQVVQVHQPRARHGTLAQSNSPKAANPTETAGFRCPPEYGCEA